MDTLANEKRCERNCKREREREEEGKRQFNRLSFLFPDEGLGLILNIGNNYRAVTIGTFCYFAECVDFSRNRRQIRMHRGWLVEWISMNFYEFRVPGFLYFLVWIYSQVAIFSERSKFLFQFQLLVVSPWIAKRIWCLLIIAAFWIRESLLQLSVSPESTAIFRYARWAFTSVFQSWEALPSDTATFTPDITPLILAAHRDNYEIIKILLDRGSTLPMPHDVRCGWAKPFDSPFHSLPP